jgi:hypothetical protein
MEIIGLGEDGTLPLGRLKKYIEDSSGARSESAALPRDG